MIGTPSCSTTSALLPIWRRIWQQARTEPTASPSGRACDVSTNRSRRSIAVSTSVIIGCSLLAPCCSHERVLLLRLRVLACALLRPAQQLVYSSLALLRPVELEDKLRRMPQSEAHADCVTDVSLSGEQAIERVLRRRLVAIHDDENMRGLAAGRQPHVTHVGRRDARVREFALDDGGDLLAQRSAQAILMMFAAAVLRHGSLRRR